MIFLATVVAYFACGVYWAKRDLPRAVERAREDWHYENSIRESVRIQTACMILFWPAVFMVRAFSSAVDAAASRVDPEKLKQEIAERDKKIAEMERELGIGRHG